jgi:isopentenyl phosphate kinase
VITDKTKPYSYRPDVVSALSEEIAGSDRGVVVVHGGGSFGHEAARQHGVSSAAGRASPQGISRTREAMFDLDRLVCKTMLDFRLSPYPFAPFDAVGGQGREALGRWLKGLLREGVTPLTFGDVVLTPHGFRIMSGDTMVQELAAALQPERCVFALDADGVYEGGSKVIIPELSPSSVRKLKVPPGEDATGGIRLKLQVAAKIAASGVEVNFVSGYRRNEFSKALRGLDFYGTTVRP